MRASSVLLVLLGCLFGAYVPFFGLFLAVSVLRHIRGHPSASDSQSWLLTSLIGICIATALCYLCFRAASALRNCQRWAAYVAQGFGFLLLLFSGLVIHGWFHPERRGPDEDFGLLIVPLFVAVGLWWCVYLNLPSVRKRFENAQTLEVRQNSTDI